MVVKIKDLVKKLQGECQDAEVEFIVVKTIGELVCMSVETKSKSMIDLLSLFNSGEPEKVHPLNEGVDGTGNDDGCS